jgi:hypothetical protein
VKHSKYDGVTIDQSLSQENRILISGLVLAILQTIAVSLRILKIQGVQRVDPAVPLLKAPLIQHQLEPILYREWKMIITLGADPKVSLKLLAINNLPAVVTLDPQAFRNFYLFTLYPFSLGSWGGFFGFLKPGHDYP